MAATAFFRNDYSGEILSYYACQNIHLKDEQGFLSILWEKNLC